MLLSDINQCDISLKPRYGNGFLWCSVKSMGWSLHAVLGWERQLAAPRLLGVHTPSLCIRCFPAAWETQGVYYSHWLFFCLCVCVCVCVCVTVRACKCLKSQHRICLLECVLSQWHSMARIHSQKQKQTEKKTSFTLCLWALATRSWAGIHIYYRSSIYMLCVSYAHQGCIYLIKNTAKSNILNYYT